MLEKTKIMTNLNTRPDQDAERLIGWEIQLKNILPEWINKVDCLKFKTVLRNYFDYVQEHIERLEGVLEDKEMQPLNIKSRFMTTFIEKTREKLSHYSDAQSWDACLLARIQSINHFKTSSYGAAASSARALNAEKYSVVFHDAEVNEKHMNERLSQLAEYDMNAQSITPIVSAA